MKTFSVEREKNVAKSSLHFIASYLKSNFLETLLSQIIVCVRFENFAALPSIKTRIKLDHSMYFASYIERNFWHFWMLQKKWEFFVVCYVITRGSLSQRIVILDIPREMHLSQNILTPYIWNDSVNYILFHSVTKKNENLDIEQVCYICQ